jgi:hypothetical protein
MAALGRDDVLPCAFEGFAGGFDGNVNVFFHGLVNGDDGFFLVEVDGFEGSAFYAGTNSLLMNLVVTARSLRTN